MEPIEYNDDQRKVLELLSSKDKTCLMVAPSFVVDFDYKTFVPLMKGLGFDKVTELTFGAKMVNHEYHEFIHKNRGNQEKFISSVCPASVELIKNKYPDLKKFLLPFDSPMVSMAKIVRKNYKHHRIVFLSPCLAKKSEAKKSGLVDVAVTFSEMKQLLEKEKPKKAKIDHRFDKFYNDYTKVYPIAGGLSATLHAKDILKPEEMVECNGCVDIMKLLDSHPDKKFYDILFCKGGCIGGPGVFSKDSIAERRKRVLAYMKFAEREKMQKSHEGLVKYSKGLKFDVSF